MRFIYTRAFRIGFAAFLALALFIIADAKGWTGIFKDGFLRVYGSTTGVSRGAVNSTKTLFQTLFSIRKLVAENAELNHQIDELSFANARLEASKNENIALRKALNFRQTSDFNLLPTEVVTSDPIGFSQVIIIDKGMSDSVDINDAVVVAPGLLVGKITKVHPNSAEVTLITDPSVKVNGEVAESGARGLVQGEHGLGLSLGLVSQNEFIKTADQIITSGLDGDLPRGLLIGRVESLQSSSSDLFQKAFVAPAANLRNLNFLFVIK